MPRNWGSLYALQDAVLACLSRVGHGFYLSGGTALSRGYYNHRYSEELDFFVNDRPEFTLWRDRCIEAIRRISDLKIDILLRDTRFGRIVMYGIEPLKIEFIRYFGWRRLRLWTNSALAWRD